jgi:hypothetical protein
MENIDTGEHVVIQGGPDGVKFDQTAFDDFLKERFGPGRWRTVTHNHPVVETVGPDGESRLVTDPDNRYPSGINGDLALAETEARATGQPVESTIDIVTEDGPAQIRYGYRPGAERPFWIDIPGPPRIQRDFATLESYHEFYEGQTGRYYPPDTHLDSGTSTPRTEGPSDAGFQDGDLVFGQAAPLTFDQALKHYRTMSALSRDREVIIIENLDTGEHVVVQGSESVAQVRPEQWARLPQRKGDIGRWRAVRHTHGIDLDTGVTRIQHRLPTGKGGDLEATMREAQRFGRSQSETLDIRTQRGDTEIRYGYDVKTKEPFWIHLPGESQPRRFKDLLEYHEWFQQQTQHDYPYEMEAD